MSLDTHSNVIILFFGITLFLYGMKEASNNLQKLMANRIRDLLAKLSNQKFASLFLGTLLTVFLQSAGAVTSMLVNLGAAGVFTLKDVMPIILGSAIGSTITVQLISFKLANFGFGIFITCFVANYLSNSEKVKRITGVGLGFGLLFVGMELMGVGAKSIAHIDIVVKVFEALSESPATTVIITTIFTAFVQSSSVVLGFCMSLVASGIIDMDNAIYWIFGANLGTTGTALLASMGGNHISRQIAWSNVFYKVGAVLIFVFITREVLLFAEVFSSDGSRHIANTHTIFNIISAIVFLPFVNYGANWVERLFPPSKKDRPYQPKFINREGLERPALAIAQTHREILRMGDVVLSMLKDVIDLFNNDDPEMVVSIRERDNKVDILQSEIKAFLVRLGDDEGLNSQLVHNISFVCDLESAADVIEKNILDAAVKANNLKLNFSDEGWEEITELHSMVYDLGLKVMTCFQLEDYVLANEIINLKREIRRVENDFRSSHYERLNKGLRKSESTSSIHLDLLSDLRRVSGLMTNQIYEILRMHDQKSK